jgi:hypothetical protein
MRLIEVTVPCVCVLSGLSQQMFIKRVSRQFKSSRQQLTSKVTSHRRFYKRLFYAFRYFT